jgi:hypothetical protein
MASLFGGNKIALVEGDTVKHFTVGVTSTAQCGVPVKSTSRSGLTDAEVEATVSKLPEGTYCASCLSHILVTQ